MTEKKMQIEELNNIKEKKQKPKIKLIIISKRGKQDNIKEKSKITLQKEKGRFEIRMENMTETIDKNKIDKTVKSIIKNISNFSFDKNEPKTHTSMNYEKGQKKNYLNKNDIDIYLKRNKNSNITLPKKEKLKKEKIILQKIKIIRKEKKENLNDNNDNINEGEKNIVLNDNNIKESNRVLMNKDNNMENESMNYKINTNREMESALSNKAINNIVINNNIQVNNYFIKEDNEKENIIKTKEIEENKEVIKFYQGKDIIDINNNINLIDINNDKSRNLPRQLISNSEMCNQSTNNINKLEQSIFDSKNKINFSYNKNLNIEIKSSIQKYTCAICDITYTSCTYYVAECNFHFLCKKCAKSFYEEKIELGAKELFCPFVQCGKRFPKNQAQKLLNKKYYMMLEEEERNNSLNSLGLMKNYNLKGMKTYSVNHVIDINNNKIFYNFNKNKNIFCSKCFNEALFCREKQLFMRCLNCGFAQCKYCFKEYTNDHLDMNSNNYCRIYYRGDELYTHSLGKIINFLIQLFLVFAMFFISIISLWKLPKRFFTDLFFKANNNNFFFFLIKIIFIYFFSFIIFVICLPINIIMFPWFPSFLALFDY